MKRLGLLPSLLLPLMFAAPVLATNTTVETVKVKDQSLLASFDTFSPVCAAGIDSAISVQWNHSIIRADGKTTQTTIVVSMHYVDSCTGDSLFMSGFSLAPNGTVNGDLSRGHVDAVVPVSTDPDDLTVQPPRTATVTLNLNFVGSGPITKITNRDKTTDGAVKTFNNFTISSRSGVANGTATAVMPLNDPNNPGTIKPKFVNLIGSPSLSASLGKDAFGSITITRKTK